MGGYATVYRPGFKPGEKILVRDDDLDQWQEAEVCENFWHANFCTVDAVTLDGKQGMFSQFRPLVLQESEHPPVTGCVVTAVDGDIKPYIQKDLNLRNEIRDHELEDIIITTHHEISNDSYVDKDCEWGRIPHLVTKGNKLVEVKTFKLYAKNEDHAKERVMAVLAKLEPKTDDTYLLDLIKMLESKTGGLTQEQTDELNTLKKQLTKS